MVTVQSSSRRIEPMAGERVVWGGRGWWGGGGTKQSKRTPDRRRGTEVLGRVVQKMAPANKRNQG